MILLQCMTAYTAVQAMMRREWDYQTAHTLLRLKRWLQPHAEFFAGEEWKLAEKYGEKDENGHVRFDGNGKFRFPDEEAGQRYLEEKKKLACVEAGEEWETVSVPRPETICPAWMEALDGLIRFGEE